MIFLPINISEVSILLKGVMIMKIIEINGKTIQVMQEIEDEKYGHIWKAYYGDDKVYVVEGKIVEDYSVINELDNKYGRPVSERDIIL